MTRRRRASRLYKPPPPPPPIRLNAIGKPLSSSFDPKWKRKMPLTSIRRLFAPYPSHMQWIVEP